MRHEELEKYLHKRVIVYLKNKFKYTGSLDFVTSKFIEITDKYGNDVKANIDEIVVIMEDKKK